MKLFEWLHDKITDDGQERKELYTSGELIANLSKHDEWLDTTIRGRFCKHIYYPVYRFFKRRRWNDVYYWFCPANVIKVKRHTRWTIYAKPELLFHANFQILNDFFEQEKECIENHIKTSWTEEEMVENEYGMGEDWARKQNEDWKTLRELHAWYNSHTNEQIQRMYDGYPPDWKLEDGVDKYDQKWYDLVEEKLLTLVKLRYMLWT